MATTLRLCNSPSFSLSKQKHSFSLSKQKHSTKTSAFTLKPPQFTTRRRRLSICSYKVVIEHEGETKTLDVDPDETILDKALDSGLSVPHDCKLGVCMTCPAKLLILARIVIFELYPKKNFLLCS